MLLIDDRLNALTNVICIPYEGTDDESELDDSDNETCGTQVAEMYTLPSYTSRDLPEGGKLRMKAFKETWNRCEGRIRATVQKLHSATVQKVIDAVTTAYLEEDPLMPYTELPTIVVSGSDRSSTMSVVSDVRRRTTRLSESTSMDEDTMSEGLPSTASSLAASIFVSSISSSNCGNLPSAFKALIGGFVENEIDQEVERTPKPPAHAVLAPYDINVLEAWFEAMRASRGASDTLKLVIFVYDFENIDILIMQSIFYICSLHIPRLPLVFILVMSSPPQSSFLHAVYPRKTLTLLDIIRIEVESGLPCLEDVLIKAFFDVDFETEVILSPAALEFVIEQFNRNAMSLDFATSIMKLIHLRHFTEPLTIFTIDELLGEEDIKSAAEKLEGPSSRPFLTALIRRLHHPEKSQIHATANDGNKDIDSARSSSPRKKSQKRGQEGNENTVPIGWAAQSASDVLGLVREAREKHTKNIRGSRVAFQVFLLIRNYLLANGFKSALENANRSDNIQKGKDRPLWQMMSACLRGTLSAREGRAVASILKKLTSDHVSGLLSQLYAYIRSLPVDARAAESETMSKLVAWIARCDTNPEDVAAISGEVGEWLVEYMSEKMRDYTETHLWDVWYTANPHGISELFNPSPRLSTITALLHSERYLGLDDETNTSRPSASKPFERDIPDTCILFQRYLESGRMINVYDWYESFSGMLETQRRKHKKDAKEKERQDQSRGNKSAKRDQRRTRNVRPNLVSPGNGKGKKGMRNTNMGAAQQGGHDDGESDEEDESEDEESKEKWKMEIQARFIRSVQELDFMGFLKHTGRKADHVQKTVYEVPE